MPSVTDRPPDPAPFCGSFRAAAAYGRARGASASARAEALRFLGLRSRRCPRHRRRLTYQESLRGGRRFASSVVRGARPRAPCSTVDILQRVWDNLVGRLAGPLNVRLILQPLMASLLAVRAAVDDARSERPAFLWAAIAGGVDRREQWRACWKDVGRVFVLAVIVDTIYQIIELGRVYPLELLLVATTLAIVPYILIRGPVARIAKAMMRRPPRVDRERVN
jgi:hypothetical protein